MILQGVGNAVLRQQVADAKIKVLRFFINMKAYTGGYDLYDPCQSWDEVTKTGVWEWSLYDATMAAIYECGAVPLICLFNENPVRLAQGMVTDVNGLPSPESAAAYARVVAEHNLSMGWTDALYNVFNEVRVRWAWYPDPYAPGNVPIIDKVILIENQVVLAIHSVISNAKVGGDEFMFKGYCERAAEFGVGFDFVGFHKHDSGPVTDPSEYADDIEIFVRAVNDKGHIQPGLLWTHEEALAFFSQYGKYPEFYVTETALNHAWNPQDYRKFSELGAAWYATEIADFIRRGVGLSSFYELASPNDGIGQPQGFGMVELWGNYAPRYPYYVNLLIGNNLSRGDTLYETVSGDESLVSALTWSHGGRAKLLITYKRPDQNAVTISGLSGAATVYRIDKSVLGIQEETLTLPANIVLDGYTVLLIDTTMPKPVSIPLALAGGAIVYVVTRNPVFAVLGAIGGAVVGRLRGGTSPSVYKVLSYPEEYEKGG